MADESQRRTQVERRDEAERRMLEAGAQLVAERGLDGLTLAEVGKAAGYSRGLPAHHFGSKSKFQDELVQFIKREYQTGIEVYKQEPGLSTLREILNSSFDLSLKDPIYLCVMQIVLSDTKGKPQLSDDILQLRNSTLEAIEFQIREGVRKGEIRHTADPRMASFLLIAAICGVLELWLADRTLDIKGAGDALVGLVLDGLTARPAT